MWKCPTSLSSFPYHGNILKIEVRNSFVIEFFTSPVRKFIFFDPV